MQTSINRTMHEQIVPYPYNGILHSSKNKWSIDAHCEIDEWFYNCIQWKKPNKKGEHTLWVHLHNILEMQMNLWRQKTD